MSTTTMMQYILTKGEYTYDAKADSLFVRIPGDYKHTIVQGVFHIDVDKQGKIVAVEILDASKVLKIPKNVLETHTRWECKVTAHEKTIAVEFTFETERDSLNAKLADKAKEEYPETRIAVIA